MTIVKVSRIQKKEEESTKKISLSPKVHHLCKRSYKKMIILSVSALFMRVSFEFLLNVLVEKLQPHTMNIVQRTYQNDFIVFPKLEFHKL